MSSYEGPLSDKQYYVLWGLGGVGCALTWFGSISIIFISRRKLASIYNRLLFVIGWVELLANFIGFFAPLMMNKDTGYPLARGNQATCSTIGVVVLFAIISKAFSSCYISIYFMLTVRYNWKDDRIHSYERMAYLVAFCMPFSYCVVGLMKNFFNPNEFRFCGISEYPVGCVGDECIRGESASILSTVSTFTSIVLSVIAIACTILLFQSVRHQTKQSTRHSFVGCINESSIKRLKLVRTQTILYVSVFLNNFVWLLLFNALVLNSVNTDDIHANDRATFASGILVFTFVPSYGFFMYCIYCFPRYSRIKEHFPEKSWIWRLKLLYTKDEGEGEILARRRNRSQSLSVEFTGTFDLAGAQSVNSLKTNSLETGQMDMNKPTDTASFHGSGDTSTENERRPVPEDGECAIHSNNDTAFSDEFMEDIEADNNLYIDY